MLKLPFDRAEWRRTRAVADDKARHERQRFSSEFDLPEKPSLKFSIDKRGRYHKHHNRYRYDHMFYARDLRVAEAKRCAEACLRAAFDPADLSKKLHIAISRTDLRALAERFAEVVTGVRWPQLTGDEYRTVALALTLAGWADTAERRFPRHRFTLNPFKETTDAVAKTTEFDTTD
jgi:hypothetical protein